MVLLFVVKLQINHNISKLFSKKREKLQKVAFISSQSSLLLSHASHLFQCTHSFCTNKHGRVRLKQCHMLGLYLSLFVVATDLRMPLLLLHKYNSIPSPSEGTGFIQQKQRKRESIQSTTEEKSRTWSKSLRTAVSRLHRNSKNLRISGQRI